MRNAQIKIGVFYRVIYPRVEVTLRLEKLRLKFHLALQINRADRRSHLHNFVHKLLLRRNRKIHPRLWA